MTLGVSTWKTNGLHVWPLPSVDLQTFWDALQTTGAITRTIVSTLWRCHTCLVALSVQRSRRVEWGISNRYCHCQPGKAPPGMEFQDTNSNFQHTKRKYGKPYARIQQCSQVQLWSNLVLRRNPPANLFEVTNCTNYPLDPHPLLPPGTPHAVVWNSRLELVSSPWAHRSNVVQLYKHEEGRGILSNNLWTRG